MYGPASHCDGWFVECQYYLWMLYYLNRFTCHVISELSCSDVFTITQIKMIVVRGVLNVPHDLKSLSSVSMVVHISNSLSPCLQPGINLYHITENWWTSLATVRACVTLSNEGYFTYTAIVEQIYVNYDFVTSIVGIWSHWKPLGVITDISYPWKSGVSDGFLECFLKGS
jgi:hypothetical protein